MANRVTMVFLSYSFQVRLSLYHELFADEFVSRQKRTSPSILGCWWVGGKEEFVKESLFLSKDRGSLF